MPKQYVIWLKSNSDTPNGVMEDQEAERLELLWMKGNRERQKFRDTEGTVLVDMDDIACIAITNTTQAKRSPGFSQ